MGQVRDCCDKYDNVFVYDVANMRNNRIKEIRTLWSESRFFYGKNRVMQLALGKTEAEEYRDGLCNVAKVRRGHPVRLVFKHLLLSVFMVMWAFFSLTSPKRL